MQYIWHKHYRVLTCIARVTFNQNVHLDVDTSIWHYTYVNEHSMPYMTVKQAIAENKTALGIEFGSTRIKTVLIDANYDVIAKGMYEWENRLDSGIWTYRLEDVWQGAQASFTAMTTEVSKKYDLSLQSVGSIGISAMMHGYLAFDKNNKLLTPFRTWRNTMTQEAAQKLTHLFQFNIPQRWSIAHLYQAILNNEEHIQDIAYITTLAGYVHWQLTGEKVLGTGDAAGMFPLNKDGAHYNVDFLTAFDDLIAHKKFDWRITDILPRVLPAGLAAGSLSKDGSMRLTAGALVSGISLCPPEGDAGTGMVATNSIRRSSGNVSAGTSIFATIILDKPLQALHTEIDVLAAPNGNPAAMVHCNNGSSDLDAWVKLFKELLELNGSTVSKDKLYSLLYAQALGADENCGGLVAYNYYSGEHITEFAEGRPLLARLPDAQFTVANLIRTLLFSSMATLRLGMEILTKKEAVSISAIFGHGGFFKSAVSQQLMAAAINTPITVLEEAGEGGAWGAALLAAFMQSPIESLEHFLDENVFAAKKGCAINPQAEDVRSFNTFMARYKAGIAIEKAAVQCFQE